MSFTDQQILDRLTELINWKNALVANSKTTGELTLMDPVDRNGVLRIAIGATSKRLPLQNLVDNIAQDLVLGNVPAKFKQVTIDFDAAGSTISKVRTAINANANYVLEQGTLYFFFVNRIVLTNGTGISVGATPADPNPPSYAVIQEFFVLTQRIQPNAQGVASLGVSGTELQSNGIRYFNTIDNRSYEPIEFDLGDIGTTVVEDAVNAAGPFSTPNGVTVLFRAVQDGDERIWLYLGAEEEIGNGFPVVDDEDFRLFPDENAVDPTPAYQESLPQKVSDLTGDSIDLSNHEGIFYNYETPYTADAFDFGQKSLFGNARVLIDTTGKTEFPKPQARWEFTVTGTTGIAQLQIGSFSYLMPFDTDEDTTVSLFVTNQDNQIFQDTGLLATADGDILVLNGFYLGVISIVNNVGDVNGTLDFGFQLRFEQSPEFEPDQQYFAHFIFEDNLIAYHFRKVGEVDYSPNVIVRRIKSLSDDYTISGSDSTVHFESNAFDNNGVLEPIEITIPLNATEPIEIGSYFDFYQNNANHEPTFNVEGGVQIVTEDNDVLEHTGVNSGISLTKTDTDKWRVVRITRNGSAFRQVGTGNHVLDEAMDIFRNGKTGFNEQNPAHLIDVKGDEKTTFIMPDGRQIVQHIGEAHLSDLGLTIGTIKGGTIEVRKHPDYLNGQTYIFTGDAGAFKFTSTMGVKDLSPSGSQNESRFVAYALNTNTLEKYAQVRSINTAGHYTGLTAINGADVSDPYTWYYANNPSRASTMYHTPYGFEIRNGILQLKNYGTDSAYGFVEGYDHGDGVMTAPERSLAIDAEGRVQTILPVLTKKISLSVADIRTLFSAPVDAIPAPPSGYYIKIIEADMNYVFNVNEPNTGIMDLIIDTATQPQFKSPSGIMTDTSSYFGNMERNVLSSPSSAETMYVHNKKLIIKGVFDNPINDSTVDVYITYKLIKI